MMHSPHGTLRCVVSAATLLYSCAGSPTSDGMDTSLPDMAEIVDSHDDTIQCPEGMLKGYESVCGNAPPECLPWQLPSTDGACLNIGPRACPAQWAGEGSPPCEPGALSPCPEGFEGTEYSAGCIPVLDECLDGEIPLLGGGCLSVGASQAYDPVAPGEYDSCPAYALSLPQGTCAIVGPRACAKSWDPIAPEDCTPGIPAPCPDGFSPAMDGLFCERLGGGICLQGLIPDSEGECRPVVDPENCPDGPYPPIEEESGDVVFVDVNAPRTDDCGLIDAPCSSIRTALSKVPAGGSVLVAPGVYEEGLLIHRSVKLRGLCPSSVVLTGSVEFPFEGGENAVVAIALQAGESVTISGISLESPVPGIVMVGAKEEQKKLPQLELADVIISYSKGVGLFAEDADLTAQRLWIHDAAATADAPDYGGAIAIRNGVFKLTDSLVEDTQGIGLDISGDSEILAEVSGSVIRGSILDDSEMRGSGIRFDSPGSLSFEHSVLEHNYPVQVEVARGNLELNGSVLATHSTPGREAARQGISVTGPSILGVNNTVFKGHTGAAVKTAHEVESDKPDVTIRASTIISGAVDGTLTQEGWPEPAMVINDGASFQLDDSLVVYRKSGALSSSGTSGSVQLNHSLVARNPDAGAFFSPALLLKSSGDVTISDSVLESSAHSAILCDGCGNRESKSGPFRMLRSKITGAKAGPASGAGFLVDNGGIAHVSDSLVVATAGSGIRSRGPGTSVVVEETTVAGVVPSDGAPASAVEALDGGNLHVVDSTLLGNSMVALSVRSGSKSPWQSTAVLAGVRIQDTQPPSAALVHAHQSGGIVAQGNALVHVSQSLISENIGANIAAFGPKTTVEIDDCAVVHSKASRDNVAKGWGIRGAQNATITLQGCRVAANAGAGIWVSDAGSLVTMSHSVIGRNGAVDDPDPASEIYADGGALVEVQASHLAPLWGHGLIATGEGTVATLVSTTMQRPLESPADKRGYGILARDGASLTLDTSEVSGQRYAGVVVSDASAHIVGSLIRDTLPTVGPSMSEDAGIGVALVQGAVVDVAYSRVSASTTVGILISDRNTQLVLDASSVDDTREQIALSRVGGPNCEERQWYGHGVLLGAGATASISDSVLARNSGFGLLWTGKGLLEQTVVGVNASFGVAIDKGCDMVPDITDSSIIGNCTDCNAYDRHIGPDVGGGTFNHPQTDLSNETDVDGQPESHGMPAPPIEEDIITQPPDMIIYNGRLPS